MTVSLYQKIQDGWIADIAVALRFDRLLMDALRHRSGHGYIRIVSYHDVPESSISSFEAHLDFFARHFEPVSLADLDEFFAGSKSYAGKPGLIVSFDDGFRSWMDNVIPALERHGFRGWF